MWDWQIQRERERERERERLLKERYASVQVV